MLPQHSVKHMYVVTEPIEGLPKPFPVFRDMETDVYMKGDAGKLLVGWFEMDAKLWNPHAPEGNRPFLEMEDDWEQAEPFIDAALTLFPELDPPVSNISSMGPKALPPTVARWWAKRPNCRISIWPPE